METKEELQESEYSPRPAWQVWLARLGLAVFLLFVVLYYIGLFGGGV